MPGRSENLALVFQEMLTAIVRIRSDRQAVSDAESFRLHMREALRQADQDARRLGYSDQEFRLGCFAVVAFLDESILNSRHPAFVGWSRKPLQEELFGGHMAGEIVFQNLNWLLAQQDSENLADVLEVHWLCLLLGYAGRYSVAGTGELRGIRDSVTAKIRRIRGYVPELSPNWAPPAQGPAGPGLDPWVRRLSYAALGCVGFMLLLFVGFKVSLSSGASDLKIIAARGR